ncbi:MAG TPA: sigma-70 family RNA polymerase sigma factor [Prolixibacteraceae bacterium]|nr:sigma-70 family RNA polymerase sigma factor [Prolixibacteraceae bacterium]
MIDERIVWEDFKQEQEYALSYIYEQNIDFLFFYGKKFSDDKDLILDTIHDLFCYLIQTRKKLGETNNIRFYLITSFRRRLLKEIQNKNKQTLIGEHFQLEAGDFTFSTEEDLIQNEEDVKRMKIIRQGINELNAKQREILYYKFTCEFDYDQICAIMTISYDAARQLVSRAINLLRKYLESKDFYLFFIFKRLRNITK